MMDKYSQLHVVITIQKVNFHGIVQFKVIKCMSKCFGIEMQK